MTTARTRVLVVDDSAFARKVVSEVIRVDHGLDVVGIARDGLDALEKIAELKPDVVTLDLVMPSLDGIGVLKALQNTKNPPRVVIVSMADSESELGVEALALGAFDVVTKPTALATDRLYELGDELRSKIIEASRNLKPLRIEVGGAQRAQRGVIAAHTSLLMIGASTGGPQALTLLLRSLPEDFPVPIAIVLHMPEGYTEAFARRVDAESALDVMEARHNLELRPGLAVIARAGSHLAFSSDDDSWICALGIRPLDTLHRPAVDVMFKSGSECAARGALGVVLTGMGSDGLAGARSIVDAGGRVLTESESSCVVYGMPRTVVEAGLSTANAPIEAMADLIVKHL